MKTVLTVLATIVVVAPATAWATNSFSDVATSDFFHDAVDWMADNDVTAGCNPPSNTRYCPNDPVTRGQMAVFMERLDTNDVFLRPSDQASDADKLDGLDSSAFLRTTGKAADADKLDGLNSTSFLRTTGKAADADQLDGEDSTTYAVAAAHAGGSIWDGTNITASGEVAVLDLEVPAVGWVLFQQSSDWGISDAEAAGLYIEVQQPTNRCDGASDDHVIRGSAGNTTGAGSTAGGGRDSVVAGQIFYSVCVATSTGGLQNNAWSVSAQWFPAATLNDTSPASP